MKRQETRKILVDAIGEAESLLDTSTGMPRAVRGSVYVGRAVLVGATALFDIGNQIVSELDAIGRALERISSRMP